MPLDSTKNLSLYLTLVWQAMASVYSIISSEITRPHPRLLPCICQFAEAFLLHIDPLDVSAVPARMVHSVPFNS